MPYKDPARQKAAQQAHYKQNKSRYKMSSDRRKVAYYTVVLEYLKTHPCIDCGESDPLVLDFDHREASEKSFSIGGYHRHRLGLEELEKEIQKCDVRCANCHRRRTATQFNWQIYKLVAE